MNLKTCLELAKVDETAFREIYDLTINRVYSYVLLRVKDRSEASDICQDIYLSLWRSLPNFQYISEPHFYSFLFKISRRQIIKWRMKSTEKVDVDEIFDIPSEDKEGEDYRVLLRKMESLNPKERVCLELRYFEDLKFKDIALALGTTENNAKVIHHRALKKLKELLEKYE
jgi:RNA polymerase sigma-70 factor (ECF subfamily)